MNKWNEYVDLLKPAGELIAKTWAPNDPQVQADLYKQLAMNISQGYFLICQSTPEHPDWARAPDWSCSRGRHKRES